MIFQVLSEVQDCNAQLLFLISTFTLSAYCSAKLLFVPIPILLTAGGRPFHWWDSGCPHLSCSVFDIVELAYKISIGTANETTKIFSKSLNAFWTLSFTNQFWFKESHTMVKRRRGSGAGPGRAPAAQAQMVIAHCMIACSSGLSGKISRKRSRRWKWSSSTRDPPMGANAPQTS